MSLFCPQVARLGSRAARIEQGGAQRRPRFSKEALARVHCDRRWGRWGLWCPPRQGGVSTLWVQLRGGTRASRLLAAVQRWWLQRRGGVALYRAVSEQEWDDIQRHRKLRVAPGSGYDRAKLFWGSVSGARSWGSKFYPGERWYVVAVRVEKSTRTHLEHLGDRLDGVESAWVALPEEWLGMAILGKVVEEWRS